MIKCNKDREGMLRLRIKKNIKRYFSFGKQPDLMKQIDEIYDYADTLPKEERSAFLRNFSIKFRVPWKRN